jgi:hypothetical protein
MPSEEMVDVCRPRVQGSRRRSSKIRSSMAGMSSGCPKPLCDV